MRGLERIFEIARQTVARWIQDTLLPAQPGDALEIDDLWSLY